MKIEEFLSLKIHITALRSISSIKIKVSIKKDAIFIDLYVYSNKLLCSSINRRKNYNQENSQFDERLLSYQFKKVNMFNIRPSFYVY